MTSDPSLQPTPKAASMIVKGLLAVDTLMAALSALTAAVGSAWAL